MRTGRCVKEMTPNDDQKNNNNKRSIRSVFTTAIKRTFLPGAEMDILINLTGPAAGASVRARGCCSAFSEPMASSQTAALSQH